MLFLLLTLLVCTVLRGASHATSRESWSVDPLSDCGGFTIDASSLRIFDACGRQRQFRGVNKVAKTAPYYPSINSFVPGNSLTTEDLVLWQSLGWNVVRLGIMMAGVMPVRSFVNQSYLHIMANITADLYDHGVYTLVDFHQDLLSEAFCADGVPAWAAHDFARGALAFPLPVDQPYNISNATGLPSPADCGKYSWSEYYFADAVAAGFQYMYTNESALADLTTYWKAVVQTLQPLGPAVLFWELMNEPWPGDMYQNPDLLLPGVADLQNLQPLYFKLAGVIRATEAATPPYYQHIIMSESITFDDFFPVGFTEIPGGAQGASLSFHYYELPNFDADWQLESRANDSRRLQALPMLTEFDIAIIDPWEPLSGMCLVWDNMPFEG
jgi:endoglycosylceramidase